MSGCFDSLDYAGRFRPPATAEPFLPSISMSSARSLLLNVNEKVRLHGDELGHEQTDAWSNRYLQAGVYHEKCLADWGRLMRRDIIPLPPRRRTWDVMEYFGFWTISSFSVSILH